MENLFHPLLHPQVYQQANLRELLQKTPQLSYQHKNPILNHQTMLEKVLVALLTPGRVPLQAKAHQLHMSLAHQTMLEKALVALVALLAPGQAPLQAKAHQLHMSLTLQTMLERALLALLALLATGQALLQGKVDNQ